MAGCGADALANLLLPSLMDGETVDIPDIDFNGPEFSIPYDPDGPLYKPVIKLTEGDLTSREIGGSGLFDGLLASARAHLRTEYEDNRITGPEYTKAYISLFESCLGNAVQYLLGREESFWQAQTAQFNAIAARVNMQAAKIAAANIRAQALTQKSTYALTKMKLSTESSTYCTAEYNLQNLLPAQLEASNQQVKNLILQGNLLTEQTEVQRSQTMDTRTDGTTVTGVLGKQKELYAQQVTSYQRDAEVKAAKIFSDAWITQKSIDEGLTPPAGFTNASVDSVLTAIKANNGF